MNWLLIALFLGQMTTAECPVGVDCSTGQFKCSLALNNCPATPDPWSGMCLTGKNGGGYQLVPCPGHEVMRADTDDDDTAEDVPDASPEDCIPQVVIIDGRPQTFCITPDEANQNENWIGHYVETHCSVANGGLIRCDH